MSVTDLRWWADHLNREPWISAQKEIKRLDKLREKITVKWGDRADEIIINGKLFK